MSISVDGPVYFVSNTTETIDETVERINVQLGRRKGYGRAIELILPEACLFMEKKWFELVPKEYMVAWIPQLANNASLNEVPDLGPEYPETNIENATYPTTDTPTVMARNQVRYAIVRTENAGFARKMFSGTKELKPRLRFHVRRLRANGVSEWIKVLAHTKEHLVEFKTFARNGGEADFLYKSVEYIIRTNGRIFGDLGMQRCIPLGSPRRSVVDSKSKMHNKVLSVYCRTEEYFYETPVVEFTGMHYVWEEIDMRFVDSYDTNYLPGT